MMIENVHYLTPCVSVFVFRAAQLQREHLQPPAVGLRHDDAAAQRAKLRHGGERHRLGQQPLDHPVQSGPDGCHAQLQ